MGRSSRAGEEDAEEAGIHVREERWRELVRVEKMRKRDYRGGDKAENSWRRLFLSDLEENALGFLYSWATLKFAREGRM